jgi:hypothetical protein
MSNMGRGSRLAPQGEDSMCEMRDANVCRKAEDGWCGLGFFETHDVVIYRAKGSDAAEDVDQGLMRVTGASGLRGRHLLSRISGKARHAQDVIRINRSFIAYVYKPRE